MRDNWGYAASIVEKTWMIMSAVAALKTVSGK